MINKEIKEIFNNVSAACENLTSENISGKWSAEQLVSRVSLLSLFTLRKYKEYISSLNGLNADIYNSLVAKIDLAMQQSAGNLKEANEYAEGIKEVGVTQYIFLSVKDVESRSERYLANKENIKKMILSETDTRAKEKALYTLYDLKNDLMEINSLLEKDGK